MSKRRGGGRLFVWPTSRRGRHGSPSRGGCCSGGRHQGDCVLRRDGTSPLRSDFEVGRDGDPSPLPLCGAPGVFPHLPKLEPLCKVRTMSLTPMMQQYQSIRRTLPPNTLLLFRLGDFYELFFEDAKLAAELLNVALTKRKGIPMCCVPFHYASGYIGKLIKTRHRVTIVDH